MTRALIKAGPACNSDCRFCHAGGPGPASASLPTRELCARMLAAGRAGHSEVVLSGGEPTMREDLVVLARFARRAGLGFGIVTNGVALAVEALRRDLLAAGLTYVHVSIHGPDRESHDALSGVRSFDAASSAVAALAGEPLELAVTSVVCRPALERLPETVRHVAGLLGPARSGGWPRHRLALLEPKGRAALAVELVPDPREASEAMVRAVGAAPPGSRPPRHDGLPPCLAPPPLEGPDDLRAHGITAMQEVDEESLSPTDAGARSHAAGCRTCAARPRCPGLFVGYLPRWGSALVPLAAR